VITISKADIDGGGRGSRHTLYDPKGPTGLYRRVYTSDSHPALVRDRADLGCSVRRLLPLHRHVDITRRLAHPKESQVYLGEIRVNFDRGSPTPNHYSSIATYGYNATGTWKGGLHSGASDIRSGAKVYADKRGRVLPFVTTKYAANRHPTWIAVFRLPVELIIGLLSHLGDPHRNIRREKLRGNLFLGHVERLTVIRKLTMTCWHLRNMLFPLLWEYVEGCSMFGRARPNQFVPLKNDLYNQCSYLIHNPTVCAYIQYVCLCTYSKEKLTRCQRVGPFLWICGLRRLRKT